MRNLLDGALRQRRLLRPGHRRLRRPHPGRPGPRRLQARGRQRRRPQREALLGRGLLGDGGGRRAGRELRRGAGYAGTLAASAPDVRAGCPDRCDSDAFLRRPVRPVCRHFQYRPTCCLRSTDGSPIRAGAVRSSCFLRSSRRRHRHSTGRHACSDSDSPRRAHGLAPCGGPCCPSTHPAHDRSSHGSCSSGVGSTRCSSSFPCPRRRRGRDSSRRYLFPGARRCRARSPAITRAHRGTRRGPRGCACDHTGGLELRGAREPGDPALAGESFGNYTMLPFWGVVVLESERWSGRTFVQGWVMGWG